MVNGSAAPQFVEQPRFSDTTHTGHVENPRLPAGSREFGVECREHRFTIHETALQGRYSLKT
ncbi:hypothetical protein [Frankia sp. AiPa1]|uniref:hypothetical protein n=1 Tax=Frankia sp. AiPa1 TaxID=573492 RepID=UPI00202AE245|nr:hypothetical protein [Frankia sp. AiPa1]MCL9762800.1 hypothetical protein [Frankia sp. AiPa1]